MRIPPLNGDGSSTSVFDAQLAEDFIEVVLHCVSADPKDDSDLLVRFALANPFSDLLLARTEMILAKRALVFALFVDEQEKTACEGDGGQSALSAYEVRSRRSIPAEISNSRRSGVREAVELRNHGEVWAAGARTRSWPACSERLSALSIRCNIAPLHVRSGECGLDQERFRSMQKGRVGQCPQRANPSVCQIRRPPRICPRGKLELPCLKCRAFFRQLGIRKDR